MRRKGRIIGRAFRAAAFLAPLLVGCVSYEMETEIRENGSGVRAIRVEISDAEMPLPAARALLNAEDDRLWKVEREERDSSTAFVFLSERRVKNVSSWEDQGGVLMRGATKNTPREDVFFRNAPEVRTVEGPEGKTLVYRERFYWTRLLESYIEWKVEHHRPDLEKAYRDASPADLGEAVGLLKGAMRHVIEGEGLDMDAAEREERFLPFARSVITLGLDAIRRSAPAANADELTEIAWKLLVEMDDPEDELFEETLPGFGLAMETEIVFRLTLPGEVVETNAKEREEGALIWRFTPLDAAIRPVDLIAETRLP